MQIETFAHRLQKALNRKNMKPIELANKTGLDKSLISNYLSGKYKAKQDKLTIIAKALDVNEVWLMGYDVPSDYSYEGGFHDDDNNRFYFRFKPKEIDENNKTEDLLEQYKVLFDKDTKLTDNQKEFILNTIEEQHRKIDEEIEKGNVN